MEQSVTAVEPLDTIHEAPRLALSGPPLVASWLVLLFAGILAGYFMNAGRVPSADSVDVGFARDMSVHHEQAVQMASLIYDRTEDEAVRSMAYDILTTQQGQIGIMSGWLDAWGLPWTSSGPQMAWMGTPLTGLMPGMATAEQLNRLRAATGPEADILFLEMMIPHHVAGVEMAEHAEAAAGEQPVKVLAHGIVEAQQAEIAYMQELLVAKGRDPFPIETGHDH